MAWKDSRLKGAVIVLAALVVYLPAMRGGFVWDDAEFVGGARMAAGTDGLRQLWLTDQPRDYFPLTSTTFWLEWRLWGRNAAGYHATNVLLHAAAAVLLWRVLERLRAPGAWLAGLIFAVHPVNVESVAWIAERKNTLSLVLYAGSLLAWLRFEDQSSADGPQRQLPIPNSQFPIRNYLLSLVLFLLALLAKTSVVMLPVVLLLCAWWRRGKIRRRDLLRAAPFFAVSLILGMVTVWFQHRHSLAGETLGLPLTSRIAAAGCAVWFYLLKAVLPLHLCAIYPGWRTADTAAFSLWPALALAGLFALFWTFRKSWGRPFLFALGYYVVMLLPVLGFFDMYVMKLSLVADRFQYPALIGVIALVIGLAAHGLERSEARLGRLAPFFAAGLVLVLGLHTWLQAEVYESEFSLWSNEVRENKESWTGWNNLACALLQSGDPDEAAIALEYARKAAALKPDHANALFNTGRALLLLNQPEEAVEPLRKAAGIWPAFAAAHGSLADALWRSGEAEKALAEYRKALEIEPKDAVIRYNFAVALVKQNRPDEAEREYETLLKANPRLAEAHNNLARLLAGRGKIGEAVTHYREALAQRPDSALILDNLAWLKACTEDERFRDGAEALALAERARRIAGDEDIKALDTLAAACAETGRFDEAVRYARKASDLAAADGQKAKAAQIGRRIELYQAHKPLRLGPGIPLE